MSYWSKGNLKIYICADDYGLSPAVNRGILELAKSKIITHISCMTIYPDWEESAQDLKILQDNFQIGLHLNFNPSFLTRSNAAQKQYMSFVNQLNKLPDYVDSHKNFHVFPQFGKTFSALLKNSSSIKIRSYGNIIAFDQTLFALTKKTLYQGLWNHFTKTLLPEGQLLNQHICCQENLKTSNTFDIWFKKTQTIISQAKEGTLMFVVHPGYVDDCLIQRDCISEFRKNELQNLLNPIFTNYLRNNFKLINE